MTNFHYIYGLRYYLNWKYGADDYRLDVIKNHKEWFIEKNWYSFLELLKTEIKRGYVKKSDNFLKILLNQEVEYEVDTRKHLEYISHTIDDEFIKSLSKFSLTFKGVNINDFLSVGQVESKIWLLETLQSLELMSKLRHIAIFGCWYNFLASFLFTIQNVQLIRGFDIDAKTCYKADVNLQNYVNNNWQYKSVAQNINDIVVKPDTTEIKYYIRNQQNEKIEENTNFDLIINTSSEHMSDDWILKLPSKQLILIQTNNMFDLPEHINCCENLDEAIKKYSAYGNIVWYGEKTMVTDYNRFMLIIEIY